MTEPSVKWKRRVTSSTTVVRQFTWTAVKRSVEPDGFTTFDIWEWNVWKRKWVRLSSSCGFGKLEDAEFDARNRSHEIGEMLLYNSSATPPPL